jgi:type III pantothenate kinase
LAAADDVRTDGRVGCSSTGCSPSGLSPSSVTGVILGSAAVDRHRLGDGQGHFDRDPLIVDPTKGGCRLHENPDEVGRPILNAIAAYDVRRARRPMVVCDLARDHADAVTAKGSISRRDLPGVTISLMRCSASRASSRVDDARSTVIGRTTVGAMQSGLFYGYVGMVEGLMRRMSAELGGNALCVATGGLAATIASEIPAIEQVDLDLTLRGRRLVWERTQSITAAR